MGAGLARGVGGVWTLRFCPYASVRRGYVTRSYAFAPTSTTKLYASFLTGKTSKVLHLLLVWRQKIWEYIFNFSICILNICKHKNIFLLFCITQLTSFSGSNEIIYISAQKVDMKFKICNSLNEIFVNIFSLHIVQYYLDF